MRKNSLLLIVILCFGFIFIFNQNAVALNQETELLLKLLEKKGVITNKESFDLKQTIEKSVKKETKQIKTDSETVRHDKLVEKIDKIADACGWLDKISFSGLIEVEAFGSDRTDLFEKHDSSDITLATVELGLDIQLNKWTAGHILLLWEEEDGDESVVVDEGTITFGNTEKFPFYLSAGKMYVPFGNFESNMIQDPLTLEIGETRESALLFGVEHSGFYGSIYVFNGDIGEKDDNAKIESYGGSLGYSYKNNDIGVDAGVDLINSITDSDGLTDALDTYSGADVTDDYVGGLAAHLICEIGHFKMIGEYISATEDYKAGELFSENVRPEAWNIEFSFTHELTGKETTFALAWQGTDDLMTYLPENRYLCSAGMEIFKSTFLTLEYFHDEDYSKKEGGTSREANVVSAQVAVEF